MSHTHENADITRVAAREKARRPARRPRPRAGETRESEHISSFPGQCLFTLFVANLEHAATRGGDCHNLWQLAKYSLKRRHSFCAPSSEAQHALGPEKLTPPHCCCGWMHGDGAAGGRGGAAGVAGGNQGIASSGLMHCWIARFLAICTSISVWISWLRRSSARGSHAGCSYSGWSDDGELPSSTMVSKSASGSGLASGKGDAWVSAQMLHPRQNLVSTSWVQC